jgi:23S rRNA (cytidine1920-2'-O)/16S rRNA (cytidine1409-2'-O)-methyltransferase
MWSDCREKTGLRSRAPVVRWDAGAARVYAVDAGHGQLLGSLRSHPRVVNLEGVNLGELDTSRVPEEVELVTLDLSYLPLADAVPQLGRLALAGEAELIALVKPAFELRLAAPPTSPELLARAVERARDGIEHAGWTVIAEMRSPVTGARGAVEFFLHARRRC